MKAMGSTNLGVQVRQAQDTVRDRAPGIQQATRLLDMISKLGTAMTTEENQPQEPAQPAEPSQIDLFEDIRNICELEDKKQAIQKEIEERTSRLKAAMDGLDKRSLLYQMLAGALAPKTKATAPAAKKKAVKKKARTSGSAARGKKSSS